MLRLTPIKLLTVITRSFTNIPYIIQKNRPIISKIINFLEISSASFVSNTFLICGTVLDNVKHVANRPIIKGTISIILAFKIHKKFDNIIYSEDNS